MLHFIFRCTIIIIVHSFFAASLRRRSIITLLEKILSEKQLLEREHKVRAKRLGRAPFGILHCNRNGCYKDGRPKYKYYLGSDAPGSGIARKYIPADDKRLISDLAQNAYDQARSKDIDRQLSAIRMFLRHYPSTNQFTDRLLQTEGMRELIPLLEEDDKFLSDWAAQLPETGAGHPENLKFKSVTGLYVRSKSEASIISVLFQNHIPFHYEEAIQINGHTIYPDFTLMLPKSHKKILWEHFGMMDDPVYRERAAAKIAEYVRAGYTPGVDIIFTFETSDHPFSVHEAQAALYYYLE